MLRKKLLLQGEATAPQANASSLHLLTKKEMAVLSWLYQGLSNKEIAVALDISPRTVEKHLERIYHVLGVHTRAQAIAQTKLLRSIFGSLS